MALKSLSKRLKQFQILSKRVHKPYLLILLEVLYWKLALGEGLVYYFDYELFLKGKKLGEYITNTQFKKVVKSLNTPSYYPILEDKYFFHKILEGTRFRIPKNLYLVDPSGIFNLETSRYVDENEFLQKDLDGFCKVIDGFGGTMIYQIDILNNILSINKMNTSFSEFKKLLGRQKFLIQERIIQHDELNALNPSCVNTIRMITVKTGQSIHLYQECLRIGINNSFVDNSYSGNIIAGMQKNTGKLMDCAYTSGIEAPQYKLESHPQTNIPFKDFSIPFYMESAEMVKSLHQLFQQFFIIGWDIGITPDGPIVIEGNNITSLYSFQVIHGGLKSSFQELADSYQRQL